MTNSNSKPSRSESYEAISPPNTLTEKALSGKNEFGADLKAIKRAEKAMEVLSENFSDWMIQEITQLDLTRTKAKEAKFSEMELDKLYRRAHDIKGQAETFGYPLAGSFCQSLCYLIDNIPDKKNIPALLVDQHVDSTRAVVRAEIKTKNDAKSLELLKKLNEVTVEFVNQQIAAQTPTTPAELDI